jgi:hypothetical protein
MKKIRWLVALVPAAALALTAAAGETRQVLLVTIDGLRWQEVFRGADEALLNSDKAAGGGVPAGELAELRAQFWADTPEARRQRLLPFFWGTVAAQGVAFGNRDTGSAASVLNAEWVSYPGYNELLTGRPDPGITGNAPQPNPNVTVLEWLDGRPAFAGRVAASAAWRTFAAILNAGRSRLPLFVTPQASPPGSVTPRIAELERWMEDLPPLTAAEHFDAFAYHAAVDFVDTRRPRVLLLALGEPDEWAHARRYDRYLQSIRRCDRFIRQLWEKLQALPEYRGTTTLLLTPDHGRGATAQDWTAHGKKTPRSDETWLAALGPDTPALGERRDTAAVHQAQVAATVAALLGEDFRAAYPEAEPAVGDIVAGRAAAR